METTDILRRDLGKLEAAAIAALRAGREQDANALWERVLQVAPNHLAALTQIAQIRFKAGDFTQALKLFSRVAELDGNQAREWVNVALACQKLNDETGEEAAILRALTVDAYDLLALILRGSLYERQGRTSEATSAYTAVLAVAPPLEQLPPELRGAVIYAKSFHDKQQLALGSFLDEYLSSHWAQADSRSAERIRLTVDILVGRKKRYESQPMRLFVPLLPAIEFFDRAMFPWFEELESHTDAIRDELLSVLRTDAASFQPYISYGADQPVQQWAELNHSPRWSAFHLVKDGVVVEQTAASCPATMRAWHQTPRPHQPGRTPVAMFSVLKPRTRIPPHVGAGNARLTVHLPLIVPAGCAFRVGNQTRQWIPGKAWAFDDTIEHEAWNDSDQPRSVFIFDTWNPMLSEDERRLITALNEGLNAFMGSPGSAYDV